MTDIVERLRAGVDGTSWRSEDLIAMDEAADEIERLQSCLDSRDNFLGSIGQWQAYVDTLPKPRSA